ncbi:MAG: hypothetical protein ABIJ46_02985 [bacterium]
MISIIGMALISLAIAVVVGANGKGKSPAFGLALGWFVISLAAGLSASALMFYLSITDNLNIGSGPALTAHPFGVLGAVALHVLYVLAVRSERLTKRGRRLVFLLEALAAAALTASLIPSPV